MSARDIQQSRYILVFWLLAALAGAIGFSSASSQDVWTENMSVTFQMGEADSRITALEAARAKMREKALSKSGAFVESRQILSGGDFSESLRLLRSAFVSITDETVKVRTDWATQVTTLELDAMVEVDNGVLRDRVKALAESTSFQREIESLSFEEQRIVKSLERLEAKLQRGGLDGRLLADYKELLVNAKETARVRAAELGQDQNVSLLDRAQYGKELLELGKLQALEEYYLDVISPYVSDLTLSAEILSASPSTQVEGATEVKVQMSVDYEPSQPVMLSAGQLESDLSDIVNGDFWLPTSPQKRMSDLELAGYDQWVDQKLMNMPLLAVLSVGTQKRYYPMLGNRISVMGKGDNEFGEDLNYSPETRMKSAFKLPHPFTTSRGKRSHREVSRTFTFQIPNAAAAVISDVEAELRVVQIQKDG